MPNIYNRRTHSDHNISVNSVYQVPPGVAEKLKMAGKTGISPTLVDLQPLSADPPWNADLSKLMMRLRHRSLLHRSWMDCIKAIRTAMTDKRTSCDVVDKLQLQRCLDTLHKAVKVMSQQAMVERLESVARQAGLKFVAQLGPETHAMISSDMFNVNVTLHAAGQVKDVKIAHQGEPMSCPDMLEALSDGNFSEFTAHLEGLNNVYQIPGDKKQKTKMFLSLQSLEMDLNLLAQLQRSINGVANYIHKSPLGILTPRRGGRPMKLVYFVSPYDLLSTKMKSAHPMTVEAITDNDLGHSVTVCLEASSSNRLQTMPLMTVNKKPDGNCLPSYPALSNVNSCLLPATFVLTLTKPIPVSTHIMKLIQGVAGHSIIKDTDAQSLLSLLLSNVSAGKIVTERELYVSLPDQQHVYFLSSSKGWLSEAGTLVSRIAFSHPMEVPQILVYLRQQLLFNSVFCSCVRSTVAQDLSRALVFELAAPSIHQICVTFEHPLHDSMVTAELDLSDVTKVRCKICTVSEDQPLCTDDYASKVFHRCLSIPITMRSIVKRVTDQLERQTQELIRKISEKAQHLQRKFRPPSLSFVPDYSERTLPLNVPYSAKPPVAPLMHSRSTESLNSGMLDPGGGNSILVNLLDNDASNPDVHPSPMLSKLLEENSSVAAPLTFAQPQPKKIGRKRLSSAEHVGRSPKQRLEDLSFESNTSMDDDSSLLSPISSVHSNPPNVPSVSPHATIDLTSMEMLKHEVKYGTKAVPNNVNEILQPDPKNVKVEGTVFVSSTNHEKITSKSHEINKNEKFPKVGQSSFDEPRESPSSIESDEFTNNGMNTCNHNSNHSAINPGEFTNKRVGSFKHGSRQSSKASLSESLDFNTELLDTDGNFLNTFLENNSDEVDLDICDANAFGVGINAMVTTKRTGGASAIDKVPYKIERQQSSVSDVFNMNSSDEDIGRSDREPLVYRRDEGPGLKMKLSGFGPRSTEAIKCMPSPLHALDLTTEKWKGSKLIKQEAFDIYKTENEPLPLVDEFDFLENSYNPLEHNNENYRKDSVGTKCLKTEKMKKKGSASSKRKKVREESKRGKKKRKMAADSDYSPHKTLYKSTTVQNVGEPKLMPILKITKSGIKMSIQTDKSSVTKDSPSSKMHWNELESMALDSVAVDSQNVDNAFADEAITQATNADTKTITSSPKSTRKSSQRSSSNTAQSAITVSKADSKLMTKTPTLKLKAIIFPDSSASVNVSAADSSPEPNAADDEPTPELLNLIDDLVSEELPPLSWSQAERLSPNELTSTDKTSPLPPTSVHSAFFPTKAKSPPHRSRKGSLSAVIDKLKNAATKTGMVEDEGEGMEAEESICEETLNGATPTEMVEDGASQGSRHVNGATRRDKNIFKDVFGEDSILHNEDPFTTSKSSGDTKKEVSSTIEKGIASKDKFDKESSSAKKVSSSIPTKVKSAMSSSSKSPKNKKADSSKHANNKDMQNKKLSNSTSKSSHNKKVKNQVENQKVSHRATVDQVDGAGISNKILSTELSIRIANHVNANKISRSSPSLREYEGNDKLNKVIVSDKNVARMQKAILKNSSLRPEKIKRASKSDSKHPSVSSDESMLKANKVAQISKANTDAVSNKCNMESPSKKRSIESPSRKRSRDSPNQGHVSASPGHKRTSDSPGQRSDSPAHRHNMDSIRRHNTDSRRHNMDVANLKKQELSPNMKYRSSSPNHKRPAESSNHRKNPKLQCVKNLDEQNQMIASLTMNPEFASLKNVAEIKKLSDIPKCKSFLSVPIIKTSADNLNATRKTDLLFSRQRTVSPTVKLKSNSPKLKLTSDIFSAKTKPETVDVVAKIISSSVKTQSNSPSAKDKSSSPSVKVKSHSSIVKPKSNFSCEKSKNDTHNAKETSSYVAQNVVPVNKKNDTSAVAWKSILSNRVTESISPVLELPSVKQKLESPVKDELVHNGKRQNQANKSPPMQSDNGLSSLHSASNLQGPDSNITATKTSPFKAPTPKSPTLADCIPSLPDMEEDLVTVKKRPPKTAQPNWSPRSDASSPEDGLVIDYPTTPKNPATKSSSPQPTIPTFAQENRKPLSSGWKRTIVKSIPSPKSRLSPVSSPVLKDSSSPGSVPLSSPCMIDDDLMDEALTGFSS